MESNPQLVCVLDNNAFRSACSRGSGNYIRNLNASIEVGISNRPRDTKFRLRPFTVLEAIGVRIPTINSIKIPNDILKSRQRALCFSYLYEEYKQIILSKPEINKDELIRLSIHQRGYVSQEALDLYDRCITNVVDQSDFYDRIISSITFDYVLKHEYPKNLAPEMHHFFCSFLFTDDLGMMDYSLMRVVKAMWDRVFSDFSRKGPMGDAFYKRANKAMKIKRFGDYLDCDIIHYLCMGTVNHMHRDPVVVFTEDSAQIIEDRVSIYKGFLQVVHKMSPSLRMPIVPHEGIIIQCGEDGRFKKTINVSSIPAMF